MRLRPRTPLADAPIFPLEWTRKDPRGLPYRCGLKRLSAAAMALPSRAMAFELDTGAATVP
jgi:hypothetical protein